MLSRSRLFPLIMVGCGQFVVLTLVAMLFYAGGTDADPAAARYQFFTNFFSDLGMTVAHNGQPNTISFLLFSLALSLAGLSLIVFFLLMPRFFQSDRLGLALSRLGAFFGIIAGVCFVGVAFTPANLLLAAHVNFVFGAFGTYFVAILFFLAAMLKVPAFVARYLIVLVVFAVILGGYLWLLFYGPKELAIQVTGQKIVAYASIITVFIVAYGASQKERQALI
ncbi:MAG: hypothetical protein IPL78_12910 [Chloroflexi bacterium]|nr:hypothetical protein [Chloroflexota bacterium]